MQPNRTKVKHSGRRLLSALLTGVVLLLLFAYLAVGAEAANRLTLPRREYGNGIAHRTPSVAYQAVSFPARGGDVQIAGWYLPSTSSNHAIVMVHGKDNNRSQEFDGQFVDLASNIERSGSAVLMIDLRGHGQSGDARFSFGLNERRDVEGAVDWLKAAGFKAGSIGVFGLSLGGASAIGAAAEEPAIGAITVDSTFADFCRLLDVDWESQSGLPNFFIPSTLFASRVLYGIDECAARPAAEIGRIAPRAVFIIYSTSDDVIPVSQPQALVAAAPFAETWVVDGPRHGRIYFTDPSAYTAKIIGFFTKHLP